MHSYQVDDVIRTRIFFTTAIFAVVTAWLFSKVIFILNLSIPWWVETPSVLGFFGIYYELYTNWLWKKWPFTKLSWFYIPDLNGKWEVFIRSSYNKASDELVMANAVIRQSASKISISLETVQSSSYSVYGTLTKIERLNDYELIYQYQNNPKPESLETMSIHRGTAWVQISDDLRTMTGEYYSGRGRQQMGSISFVRKTE